MKAGEMVHRLATTPRLRSGRCCILLVMLTNLIFATFTALLAHWAGDLSIELAVFVGWVTFRLETMATSFNLLVGAVQTQAVVENARLQTEQARVQLEQARYESAVAAVASNN